MIYKRAITWFSNILFLMKKIFIAPKHYSQLLIQQDLIRVISLSQYLVIKRTEQYNKLFEGMEFTHINKCQTPLQKHHQLSSDAKTTIKYDSSSAQRSNLEQILTNIDQITTARSFHTSKMNQQDNTMASSKSHFQIYPKHPLLTNDESKVVQFESGIRPIHQRKSLIYSENTVHKDQVHQSLKGLQVKIFYFNLPTYKLFNYHQNTTIQDIIIAAVQAYLNDRRLDSNKIQDPYFKNFEVRLLLDENKHEADMSIPPLSYDRLLIDNLIDGLVLIETQKYKQSKNNMGSRQKGKAQVKLTADKQEYINIFLLSEEGEQLSTFQMRREESIISIYHFIQQNDLHQMKSFYLAQSKNNEQRLPKDFQVKHLQSNKLYVYPQQYQLKVRKFIDESEISNQQPQIKNNYLKSKSYDEILNLPISLKQASQYEQFTVTKVNKFGSEQQRILGIDQDKIYNYSVEAKQQKKEPGFFKKLFGINETTGTKRPFRLIKDIIQVHNTLKGFNLTYKDKTIIFQVKDPSVKQKIIRKLQFLVSYASNEQKNIIKR